MVKAGWVVWNFGVAGGAQDADRLVRALGTLLKISKIPTK